MALVSLRQVLDHAAENQYGVPAFNVNNLEQVQAIMMAAQVTDSPVILQQLSHILIYLWFYIRTMAPRLRNANSQFAQVSRVS